MQFQHTTGGAGLSMGRAPERGIGNVPDGGGVRGPHRPPLSRAKSGRSRWYVSSSHSATTRVPQATVM